MNLFMFKRIQVLVITKFKIKSSYLIPKIYTRVLIGTGICRFILSSYFYPFPGICENKGKVSCGHEGSLWSSHMYRSLELFHLAHRLWKNEINLHKIFWKIISLLLHIGWICLCLQCNLLKFWIDIYSFELHTWF